MDLLLDPIAQLYDQSPLTVVHCVAGLVLACAATNFAFLHWQVLAIAGSRGLWPMAKRSAAWRREFPRATQLKYSPSNWVPFQFTDSFLYAMVIVGAIVSSIASMCLLVGPAFLLGPASIAVLLWLVWFWHLVTTECCFMTFPWHSLISESLFVLAVAGTPALVSFEFTAASTTSAFIAGPLQPTATLVSLCLRCLVFRVMFGFGKNKFIGAQAKDRMYIKPFVPAIPLPALTGWYMYNYLPDWFYLVGYGMFFISEIITPLVFFSPVVWQRAIASALTVKLMIGIILSGNFGNFNVLTSILALLVPLPVFGADVFGLATDAAVLPSLISVVVNVFLSALIIVSLPLLVFNSWVQQSWFNWTAFRVAAKPFAQICAFYEMLCLWRVLHPFGIFPPNTFAAQRQVYVFEGSADGKTYKPYRFKFTVQGAFDKPPMLPQFHPFLDFNMFYQLLQAMFTRTMTNMSTPVVNGMCRPLDAVARNLLEGGAASELFAQPCPFPSSQPPKFIRVVQITLRPVSREDKEFGTGQFWHEERGQLELAPQTLETIHRIPEPVVSDVNAELDFAHRVWRMRTNTGADRDCWNREEANVNRMVEKTLKEVQSWQQRVKDDAGIQRILSDAIQSSSDAVDGDRKLQAATRRSDARRSGGKAAYLADVASCNAIHKQACVVADTLVGLGWPFSGEHPAPNKKRLPTSSFQTYLFALWLLCRSEKELTALTPASVKETILAQAATKDPETGKLRFRVDEGNGDSEVHDGVRLFATLNARAVRVEASQFRRFFEAGAIPIDTVHDDGADSVCPGYLMYWRAAFQKQVRYEWDENAEGSWGSEYRPQMKFNMTRLQYDFKGTKVE